MLSHSDGSAESFYLYFFDYLPISDCSDSYGQGASKSSCYPTDKCNRSSHAAAVSAD